jgi:hypothetical protein
MAFTIKLRTKTVEIILDQDKAEQINRLGVKLAARATQERITEATDMVAKQFAQQIETLSKEAEKDTLILELKALSFSQWKEVLAKNTIRKDGEKGMRDMLGVTKTALPEMLVTSSLGGKPVDDEDLKPESLGELIDQLTDGQFTPLWNTIMDLNGKPADPKAARDLASKILS